MIFLSGPQRDSPLDAGRELDKRKAVRNVLHTFNLRLVSRGSIKTRLEASKTRKL